MEVFSKTTNIDFMGMKGYCILFSIVTSIVSIYLWIAGGERILGVDFVGGAQVDVHFEKPVDINVVRSALEKAKVESFTVQHFSGGPNPNAFSIRFKATDSKEASDKIASAFSAIQDNKAAIDQSIFIGPVIGKQVLKAGIEALVLALLGILLYVGLRFDFGFALGAVVALIHDVIIVTGVFIATGREISSILLAAALTIIGYSVNDSIVVLDRVRENLTKLSKTGTARKRVADQRADVASVINLSINQTLSRTILTGLTTFLTAVTLWIFGAGSASDLSFAICVGILIGTYSSVFVGAPIVLYWWKPKAA